VVFFRCRPPKGLPSQRYAPTARRPSGVDRVDHVADRLRLLRELDIAGDDPRENFVVREPLGGEPAA
jgi:hypothetical protein